MILVPPFFVLVVTTPALPKVDLSADEIRIEASRRRLVASGRAHLQVASSSLSADRLTLDLLSSEAEATGHVRWRSATAALRSDRLGVTSTRGSGQLRAEGITIYPCLCPSSGPGLLSIDAHRAEVDQESGVTLISPTVRIAEVPVLWLPALYYPVGPRRSGLLLPELGHTPALGFWGREPIYLAPDRSWDLSLAPGWAFERGPLLDVEGRWAIGPRSHGGLRSSFVVDLAREPEGGDLALEAPRLRGEWVGFGRHRVGSSNLAAHVDLVSDAGFRARFGPSVTERAAEWARTAFGWFQPLERFTFAGLVVLHQDLRQATSAFYAPETPLRDVSALGRRGPLAVRQRLLELRVDEVPQFHPGRLLSQGYGSFSVSVHGALDPEPERFLRADLRRAFGFSLLELPAWGTALETEVAGRVTGWTGREGAARAAAVATTRVVFERGLGLGDHGLVLRGELAHLLIPGVWVLGPVARFATGDEIDLLEAAHQIRARKAVELRDARGRARGHLAATLGVDFGSLERGDGEGLSELGLELHAPLLRDERLRLTAVGDVVLDLSRPALRALELELELIVPSLFASRVRWARFGSVPPRLFRLVPEELLPSATAPASEVPLEDYALLSAAEQRALRPWSRLDAVQLGATVWVRRDVTLGMDVDLAAEPAAGSASRPSVLRSLMGRLGLEPRCSQAAAPEGSGLGGSGLSRGRESTGGCFRASVFAGTARDLGSFVIGASLEVRSDETPARFRPP